MYLHSYLHSSAEIIELYDGQIPFASWLKNYFKQHKKFGSRDRKLISDLCFSYYRLGQAFTEKSTEEKLLIAQFLCHEETAFIKELKPVWLEALSLSIDEKLKFIGPENFIPFNWEDELSSEIDEALFNQSHLIQPDVFVRIRPGKKDAVLQKLGEAYVSFEIENDCLRFSSNTKLDDILEIDKEVVVQDKNSQKVLNHLQLLTPNFKPQTSWDCCAASGGKSILLHDNFPKTQLTVSDVRQSILVNLKNRFIRAGINNYKSFVADVSSSKFLLNQKFDLIICDAPCSGSGTWGRTPEQLVFFAKEKIEHYTSLQKAITANAIKQLKPGGAFLYITCSVFKKENEDVVQHILQNINLQLKKAEYFKGYTEKADTLFAALFIL